MADIIRKMTVEKGYDPRDFALFAFGGAGPVHASVFGSELGVKKVIVPLREIASTWCAFGAASADILHIYEQVDIQGSAFDTERVNRVLQQLQDKAEAQMTRDGVAASRRRFSFSLDMRHPRPDQRGRVRARHTAAQAEPARRAARTVLHPLRAVVWPQCGVPRRAPGDRHAAGARKRRHATPRAFPRQHG
jgi:hypothetical protein